jgi:hypothetical protein
MRLAVSAPSNVTIGVVGESSNHHLPLFAALPDAVWDADHPTLDEDIDCCSVVVQEAPDEPP